MQLLIESARAHPDGGALRVAAASTADWDRLLGECLRHSMAPMVYWRCRHTCPDAVPPAVLDRLRASYYANARRNLAFADELLGLAALFGRAGIDAVPFKGPAIAWPLYESPALREMNDLDLLVHPHDLPRAIQLLVSAGYRGQHSLDPRFSRSGRELALTSPAGLAVDLHWSLAPSYFCHALDLDRFWSRLVPVSIAGHAFHTLAPGDLLIFLCVHGAKHSLAAYVHARRISRTVYAGLLLAADILGAAVPAAILGRARACPQACTVAARSQLWLHGRPVPHGPSGPEFRFRLSLLERPPDKLRLCWSLLAPQVTDGESLPLPEVLFPVYYGLRPLRLTVKYAALAARGVWARVGYTAR
jgi:hypothetical protein